ncbi:MAG: methionine--tRNA ligase [Alphaproteobacteria bacterium RIFCSPHIGHO2_01_FULL_41_14]|nr:MAG: methionine--tRNA ligase [Alphaproteobacteria bacterium GWB1_45_5]OFW76661.1 MAG: methionine--tRNA ligase [Alphaproteobacteria bacterium GWA1_45_9]OFW89739.1 MAG: methionine--tRNA ligase [Alphaproteobacteria bacterium RIFCSPHIGHO2_01_FULL_41_14]
MMQKTYYITTPIYYPNSTPHIGSVYTNVCCDILARFKRLDGYDVKFLTGTDEHGQKVEQAAKDKGLPPQVFVDQISENFRQLIPAYALSCDDFIRTTEPRHKKGAQAFWTKLVEKGEIYLGHYAGWYSVRDEAFYTESDLVDGRAPTGAPVEWVEESSYFFRLSHWQDKLLKFYEDHPHFIGPESRRNEVISFVKGGLKDISVSRTTFEWGIPVPHDPSHIMYVWIDALTNYITALGYPDTTTPDFKKFWPADLHMVGKDILRFHAIFWPAFLMAADLSPPQKIFAHGWWTVEGEKMSKSLGNVVDPYALVEKYGADVVRYFLIRGVSFGSDGDFSETALVQRANTQLSNELGNLAQRILSMVNKNCEGQIPTLLQEFSDEDQNLLTQAQSLLGLAREHLDKQELHKYADTLWNVVWAANKYVDEQAPWNLKKTDFHRMEMVLYTVMETLRYLGILLQPMIPETAKKLLDALAVPRDQRTFAHLSSSFCLKQAHPLPVPFPLFPRIEPEPYVC